MGGWAFLGGFLAVAIAIAIIVSVIRRKIRRFSRQVFGNADISKVLSEIETEEESTPRSLNGCDSLVIPQILKDFPDFDVNLMKTYARKYLKEKLGSKPGFQIHNVVIARYLPTGLSKTIILQAALSWKENNRTSQKRYDLHYTYQVKTGSDTIAANCPNCGATLSYGVINCPYCESRVANVMGNTWEFTHLQES